MVILAGVTAVIWVWAISDVIAFDFRLRPETKDRWIGTVMLIPVIGALAWLLRGRPTHADSKAPGRRLRSDPLICVVDQARTGSNAPRPWWNT
ncbi:PLD nuclease N-terminal domain-containing protein [Mycolicibacterium madagascariense]|uniref:PLD nuclease N-terminal domain-containing protein n=1 Tax=Mycolicibacterium madagascariense TaxID=212765 RepID=UPI0013D702D7|nr:PLDc_N domain-containing protein [Mycolicibacterium madagascariense]